MVILGGDRAQPRRRDVGRHALSLRPRIERVHDHLSAGVYEIEPLEFERRRATPRAAGLASRARPARRRRSTILRELASRTHALRADRDLGVSAHARRGQGWVRSRASSSTRAGTPVPTGARCDCATGARSTSPRATRRSSAQGARCMDCGIPFCMQGCPLGNRDPRLQRSRSIASHWAQRRRAALRHEQLSRVHRSALSRPVRVGLRARHLRAIPSPSNASSTRSPSTPSPTASPCRARRRARTGYRVARRRLGTGRPRRRGAAAQRRPRGDASSSAATRSGGFCATASPSSRWKRRVLDRRLAVMARRGRRRSTPASASVRTATSLGDLHARLRRRRARARFDPSAHSSLCRAPNLAGVYPGHDLPRSLQSRRARRRGRRRSTRRGRTSSSWAAATPVPTAWAPCIARAPRPSCRSRSWTARPTSDRRTSRGRRWRGSSRPPPAHDEGGERRFSTETLEFRGDGRVDVARR